MNIQISIFKRIHINGKLKIILNIHKNNYLINKKIIIRCIYIYLFF